MLALKFSRSANELFIEGAERERGVQKSEKDVIHIVWWGKEVLFSWQFWLFATNLPCEDSPPSSDLAATAATAAGGRKAHIEF